MFDETVFSAEVGMAKPDARIYQLILNRLGVEPQEAVFVDDFIENVEGARHLGLHAIHFKNSPQALAALQEFFS
jgi:epoxide hydrolase-like predicted phosphatase